ncbi:hypothetical protein SGRIM128S_03180 [Streptomyces griseomycini]
MNQGFFGSATGNDESDPNVLQADYSYSDHDGLTWKHERITAEIKNPAWAGMFASSGEGVQLRHGKYAGRLIQQYAVRHNGANYAVSAYSDDHGATWKTGTPVGPGGDENKTVELSDGRVMLNNRSAPYRTVAHSTDGGVTYTPFQQDKELPDPANNGSVMRFAPDVPATHPRASWLMFSNTATTDSRSNLTVRLSCDNGQNWPVRKTVEAGSAAYSTLTPLGDGTAPNPRVGLLWDAPTTGTSPTPPSTCSGSAGSARPSRSPRPPPCPPGGPPRSPSASSARTTRTCPPARSPSGCPRAGAPRPWPCPRSSPVRART